MRATGTGVTLIAAAPSTPSTVALIATGPPTARARAIPVAETDTMLGALDEQVTSRAGSSRSAEGFPAVRSRRWAVLRRRSRPATRRLRRLTGHTLGPAEATEARGSGEEE